MMPIDTRLDGNPATLYAGSQYLRARLGFEVDGAATTLRAVGDEARHGWLGSAGAAFSDRMTAAATRADALRAEVDATALTFSQYADMLTSAQTTMLVARQIAASGGLIVAGTMILDPYSPDPATYQQQRLTYALAVQQVSQARTLMVTARTIAQARQSAARAQPMIKPGDVVGGAAGAAGGAPRREANGSGEIRFAPEQREPSLAHEQAHVPQQGGARRATE
ncbi:hypothetical protein [Actinoplanes sp. CA-252034]|uniref:hypothetical protein n=1 Tax=Actinoplanes sp. CA-252034 TaxID=3239906 RepID=UPI003D965A13